jgi:hypothetical protein
MGKTLKNLASLLRETAIVSSMVVPLFFAGCKKPDKNYAPEATLEVNPTSGNAPMKVRMKLTGADLDGPEDIKGYRLNIDGIIKEKSSPYDTTITFRTPGKYTIIGEVVDKKNEIGSKYEYVDVGPIKLNPFKQPNDSTLNWYGSGDVNNDNTVNSQDLSRLNEIITGTYSNPSDTRLMDRADVNGDGVVDSQDAQLLESKLNGSIPYLPGDWNLLMTRQEREDWLKKMLAIDKTDEIPYSSKFGCVHFAYQTMINFNGFVNPTDISRLQAFYPFDFSNNGRFNLPVCILSITYDSDGKPKGHDRNAIFLGGNTSDRNSRSDVEPQNDQINIATEQDPVYGLNSKFYIRGPPTIEMGGGIASTDYLTYEIKNNIPTLIFTNPDLITKRGK